MINANLTHLKTMATAPRTPETVPPTTIAARGDGVELSPEALAAVDPSRCGNDWRCLEKIWPKLD